MSFLSKDEFCGSSRGRDLKRRNGDLIMLYILVFLTKMLEYFGVARPIIQVSRINQWRIVFEVKDEVL